MLRPGPRYPDETVEVLDTSFGKYRLPQASVEHLADGCRWSEGPVWFGDGRFLLWSDIPNNRMMKWEEETGAVSVFRKPSHYSNGNTRDRQGRLVTCEHDARRVTRTEHDGTITILMDHFDGKPLNSPNDIVVKSDGSVWFTDPPFGIAGHYEGHPAPQELPTNIYRLDPETGQASVVSGDVIYPNGLCFSPDEKLLYVVESRSTPRHILAFDVTGSGTTLSGKRILIDPGPDGTPDGIRCDVHGNIWAGWGMTDELDGVRIFNPDGRAVGHVHLPERCANLCFGGVWRNRLFMAASHSVYSLYVNTQGAPGG